MLGVVASPSRAAMTFAGGWGTVAIVATLDAVNALSLAAN